LTFPVIPSDNEEYLNDQIIDLKLEILEIVKEFEERFKTIAEYVAQNEVEKAE